MVNITEGRPTDPQPHETSPASPPASTESLESPNAPGAPEASEAPGEPEVPRARRANASGEPGEAGVPGEPESVSARRRSSWLRRKKDPQEPAPVAPVPAVQSQEFEVAPNDPLVAYFQSATGAVDITALELESPALDEMRGAGVVLAVPLVASGELIGLLSLGPRLSERGHSTDDRQLLDSLGDPRRARDRKVGQLIQEQEDEARRRERMEQELVVAQLIQQQFLPKTLPQLPGFHVTAFYRPARQVGGDFYDFIELPDGRVMIVVGDVTDKGVPAALGDGEHSLAARPRSAAPQLLSPGEDARPGEQPPLRGHPRSDVRDVHGPCPRRRHGQPRVRQRRP